MYSRRLWWAEEGCSCYITIPLTASCSDPVGVRWKTTTIIRYLTNSRELYISIIYVRGPVLLTNGNRAIPSSWIIPFRKNMRPVHYGESWNLPAVVMVGSGALLAAYQRPTLAAVAAEVVVGLHSFSLTNPFVLLVAERYAPRRRYQLCYVLR